jgi:hypothetical protein
MVSSTGNDSFEPDSMLKRDQATLLIAFVLTLTPIPGLSQMGGMVGGRGAGGIPTGGSMPGGTGPAGWPGSAAGNSNGMGMDRTGDMSGTRDASRMRGEALWKGHRDLFDFDPRGNLIVRNEIVGIGGTAQGMAIVQAAGFVISRRDALEGLDADIVVWTAPKGMSAQHALLKLREIDPDTTYDFNHIYFESATGAGTESAAAAAQARVSSPPGNVPGLERRVGLIDGGVEPSHPALQSLTLHSHGCNGTIVPSAHGTAIASRLVDGFAEAAPAALHVDLYAADVYCGAPNGGSTSDLIQGLAWLIQEDVPVINVSLVGPPNTLLRRVVETATARGYLIVAAVGNDGPAAPALYPAAYPGVVAVTGVDHGDKVLIEAGRGEFVAFAAPGADIRAASLPSGSSPVRGTSFAVPIVTSRLALLLERPNPVAAERAVRELAASAVDLGLPGRDWVYGYGCIGCAAPSAAGAAAQSH